MKQKKFPQELQIRRPYREQGWRSKNNLDKWATEDRKADEEGLALLMHHFGIDYSDADCWRQLSLAMARRFFAGFSREKAEKGPKKKWDVLGYAKLLKAVSDVVAATKQSEKAALETVREQSYRRVALKSLASRFAEAKRHEGLNRMLGATTAPVVPRTEFASLWRCITDSSEVVAEMRLCPTDTNAVVVFFADSGPSDEGQETDRKNTNHGRQHRIGSPTISVQSTEITSLANFGQSEAMPSGDGIRVRNPKARFLNR